MKKYIILQFLLFCVCVCYSQDITLNKIVEYPTCGEYYDKDNLCVKDQYLFAASFYGLEIYNVEPNTPAQLLSRLPLPGEARAIEVKNNYAYVQSLSYNTESYSVLYKIDITNIYEPRIVQSIYNENQRGYAQIDAYNDFIILMNYDISYNFYYSIYSIPDLEFIQNYYCSTTFLKVNDSLAFKRINMQEAVLCDMSNPQNITEIEEVDFGTGGVSINNIQTVNDTLLACLHLDGISFWNYSDIHNIHYISTIFSASGEYWGNYFYKYGNFIVVIDTGLLGLESIDISNIYTPYVVDTIVFSEYFDFHTDLDVTGIGNSVFSGEECFMNQVVLNNGYFDDHYIINEYYGQSGGEVYNDYVYVNFLDGLIIYDVSSLPEVEPVDTLYTDHVLYSMQRVGNFLYIIDFTDYTIHVLDITNPVSPTIRNEIYIPYPGYIFVSDSPYEIYYIRADNYKLYKYSFPEPNDYILNFQFSLNCGGEGFIYNNYFYYIIQNTGGSDLRIYGGLDENDPECITTIENIVGGSDWLNTNNYGNIFYLSDWGEWEGYTMYYEIGEPTEITYIFSTPHCYNGEFFIDGDYLYTGGSYSLIDIFNFETASGSIEPIGDYQDYGFNLSCKEYESNGQKYLYHFQSTAFSIYEIDGYAIDPEPEVSEQLFTSYPNPFTNSTTLSFNATTNLHELSQIKIYNVKGQLVRTLRLDASSLSRFVEVMWDGKDENGKDVKSDVYFYKLAGNDEHVGKVVKIQ